MGRLTRREFLKIAGTSAAGSALACGCASRSSTITILQNPPQAGELTSINTGALGPSIFIPDRVAYICECKPNLHNPGGGGDVSLFIGNYCEKSERFLLHWDLTGLPAGLKFSRAVVRLYCTEIYGHPSGRLIYAPLNSSWGNDVTYNSQPENDPNGQIIMEWPGKGKWQEVEATAIVNQWLATPETNYGLIGYAVDISEETCSAVFSSIQVPEGEKLVLSIA